MGAYANKMVIMATFIIIIICYIAERPLRLLFLVVLRLVLFLVERPVVLCDVP